MGNKISFKNFCEKWEIRSVDNNRFVTVVDYESEEELLDDLKHLDKMVTGIKTMNFESFVCVSFAIYSLSKIGEKFYRVTIVDKDPVMCLFEITKVVKDEYQLECEELKNKNQKYVMFENEDSLNNYGKTKEEAVEKFLNEIFELLQKNISSFKELALKVTKLK